MPPAYEAEVVVARDAGGLGACRQRLGEQQQVAFLGSDGGGDLLAIESDRHRLEVGREGRSPLQYQRGAVDFEHPRLKREPEVGQEQLHRGDVPTLRWRLGQLDGHVLDRRGHADVLGGCVDDGPHAVATVAQVGAVEDARVGDAELGSVELDDRRLAGDVEFAVPDARVVGERQADGEDDGEERERQQEDDRWKEVVPRHDPLVAARDVAQHQHEHDRADGDADEGRNVLSQQPQEHDGRKPSRDGDEEGDAQQAERLQQAAGGGAALREIVLGRV